MRATTLVVTALACAVSGVTAASPPTWSGGTTQALLTEASGGESQAELTITPSDDVTGMDLKMSWEVIEGTTKKIFIAVEAATTGWVGLGIAEAAGMRGADLFMGHVASDGTAVVGDYHSIKNGHPIKDECQDWTVHYGEQLSGWTLLVVSRDLNTADPNDWPIVFSSLKRFGMLAAYGPGQDTYLYHGNNRVKFQVNLKTGDIVDQAEWSAAQEAAGHTKLDLKVNEAGDQVGNPGGHPWQNPSSDGQLIPHTNSQNHGVGTTYWEYCFSKTWDAESSKHIVGFESISDGEPDHVHHFVVYGLEKAGCSDAGYEEVIWVGGIGFYDDLPDDLSGQPLGISFSRYKSIRIQVHYDNPDLKQNLKDNSGARIWLSDVAPSKQVGILQLGDGQVQMQNENIPVGKSHYQFTCPASVTSNWPSITVFGSVLHMHKSGDQMSTEIVHADGKKEMPNSVEYFDFGFQDPTMLEPYTITPGDALITRCYYNNQVGGSLKFGLGSDAEMCIDFLYYYPHTPAINEHCGFASVGSFDGKNIADTPDTIGAFGQAATGTGNTCSSTTVSTFSPKETSAATTSPKETSAATTVHGWRSTAFGAVATASAAITMLCLA